MLTSQSTFTLATSQIQPQPPAAPAQGRGHTLPQRTAVYRTLHPASGAEYPQHQPGLGAAPAPADSGPDRAGQGRFRSRRGAKLACPQQSSQTVCWAARCTTALPRFEKNIGLCLHGAGGFGGHGAGLFKLFAQYSLGLGSVRGKVLPAAACHRQGPAAGRAQGAEKFQRKGAVLAKAEEGAAAERDREAGGGGRGGEGGRGGGGGGRGGRQRERESI